MVAVKPGAERTVLLRQRTEIQEMLRQINSSLACCVALTTGVSDMQTVWKEGFICYFTKDGRCYDSSLDSLSVSRSGKSSGELSSVMVRNPKVGNSLEVRVDL